MKIPDFKTIVKLAVLLVLPGAVTACSDDIAGGLPAVDSRLISFRVAGVEGERTSRAAAPAAEELLVARSDNGDTLYLAASVAPTAPAVASRAVAFDAATMSDFGVYALLGEASQSDEVYMDNVSVARADGWTPRREYLWPGEGSLKFIAYSPYAAAPSSEGITSLPDYPSSGKFLLGFTTPADVADQFDLLRACPVEASASPCALQFEHSLTAVRFATGSKMASCHVDRIEVAGVASVGTLDLLDGSWADLSTPADFAIEPDCALTAAAGSEYVAPMTPISSDGMTLMFIPQTLGDDAAIKLTITAKNGSQSEFTASLAGARWASGTTVTYNLSADPVTESLTIDLLDADGNKLDSIASPYTGADLIYKVRSVYSDGSTVTPVAWKATFVDADGNELAASPDWIVSYPAEGAGIDSCRMTTQMAEPIFLAMNRHTEILRQAADINETSGHTPYNLASTDGSPAVMNTANSYIINAPGRYSIPLVYGNAIKAGATNSAAYTSTITSTTAHKKKALLQFINHLGNPITDPYIYNNTGCTPSGASIVWEDRLNLVRNVELSADGHSLIFEVPAASIRQGNAVIAVTDPDGQVIWSWQLWVTDFKLDDGWLSIDDPSGVETRMLSTALGRLYAGDNTLFPRQAAKLRFTQTEVPAALQPVTVEIPVVLDTKTVHTGDSYTYFQWGRKDAMISGLDVYYNAAHQEMDSENIPRDTPSSTHRDLIIKTIRHPDLFVAGDDASLSPITSSGTFYQNLWSINQIDLSPHGPYDAGVKTVYDPSPVGAKVSVSNAFLPMLNVTGESDQANLTQKYSLPTGVDVTISMLGYRSGHWGGVTVGSGVNWTTYARSATMASYISFAIGGGAAIPYRTSMLYGYSVIPVADE